MFKLFNSERPYDRLKDDPPGHFNLKQQKDRAADEMVGLCRGLLSDGVVTGQEAAFLKDWIERNAIHAGEYPFNVVYRQLQAALLDGVLDADEEQDLLATLVALVGGEAVRSAGAGASLSSSLPLCDPAPKIEFERSVFVVTGTFSFGTRRVVVDAIEGRGGVPAASISKKVNYLVIGEVGSQAWRHSSYGRKIEAAVDLRESGVPIRIVSEPHWRSALSS